MDNATYKVIEQKVKNSVLKTWSQKELAELYNNFLEDTNTEANQIIDLQDKSNTFDDPIIRKLSEVYNNNKQFEQLFKIPRFIILADDGHYVEVVPQAYVTSYWSDIFLRAMAFPYVYDNIGTSSKSLYSDEIHPHILIELGIKIDVCLNTIQFK